MGQNRTCANIRGKPLFESNKIMSKLFSCTVPYLSLGCHEEGVFITQLSFCCFAREKQFRVPCCPWQSAHLPDVGFAHLWAVVRFVGLEGHSHNLCLCSSLTGMKCRVSCSRWRYTRRLQGFCGRVSHSSWLVTLQGHACYSCTCLVRVMYMVSRCRRPTDATWEWLMLLMKLIESRRLRRLKSLDALLWKLILIFFNFFCMMSDHVFY